VLCVCEEHNISTAPSGLLVHRLINGFEIGSSYGATDEIFKMYKKLVLVVVFPPHRSFVHEEWGAMKL
jgi:hypothetical protein